MSDQIQAFGDFRVCAWMSNGLVTAITETVAAVAPYLARVGAGVAVAVALASPSISIAAGNNALAQTSAVIQTVVIDHVGMDTQEAAGRSVAVAAELRRIRSEIEEQSISQQTGVTDDIAPSTLALAEAALARIQSNGMVFSKEWASRVASGKA